MARSGSRWLFVPFLSGEWLGAFFAFVACRKQYSQLAHFYILRQYPAPTMDGLHTADFAATRFLLLQNCSRSRPRRELLVLHPELVLLQRRTAAATARAATVTTIEEAALGYASLICCDSSC